MEPDSYLDRSRRKTVAGSLRELLDVMATQADAGAPQGTIKDWAARTPGTTEAQTRKALERLVTAGHVTKAWDASRYLWLYRITL